MNRTTLNGLQPREGREVDRNPYDWTELPIFAPSKMERETDRITAADLVILVIGIVSAVLVLAFKFGGGV